MNRREAIAALTSLPGLTSVQVADIKPNDVLVFEVETHLSAQTIQRIKDFAGELWPGHRVAVLDAGMKLKVMREQG
jgi:hypothetical protein